MQDKSPPTPSFIERLLSKYPDTIMYTVGERGACMVLISESELSYRGETKSLHIKTKTLERGEKKGAECFKLVVEHLFHQCKCPCDSLPVIANLEMQIRATGDSLRKMNHMTNRLVQENPTLSLSYPHGRGASSTWMLHCKNGIYVYVHDKHVHRYIQTHKHTYIYIYTYTYIHT